MITRLNIGGPARQALLLARGLAPRYETTLAAGRPARDEGELDDPEVEVTRLPLVRPVRPRTDARALVATRSLLDGVRPALLHTHMAKAGTVGRVAAHTTRPRPRLVHTFHGHVLDGYFGRAARRAFLATERVLAARTDVLVAVSAETMADLLDLGIGRPEQYRVIPLGLELERHRAVAGPSGDLRRSLGLAEDTPLVGTVGRLVPIKDVGTLLRAMTALDGVHLAIVGDGEQRGELQAMAEELGVARRTHFTGWMRDIPSVMSDLDVVALTSRNEGTPVSLIEAAACGRAVVATQVGGVSAVVDHDVTGLVVPPADPAAVADAIGALLADERRRCAMGAAGRTRSARFSAERLVADIRDLYDELIGT